MVSLKLPDEVFPFYCHECGVKNFRKLLVKLSPHLIENNTAVGLVSGDVIRGTLSLVMFCWELKMKRILKQLTHLKEIKR